MEVFITDNQKYIDTIVDIHLKTFTGFFLTFLGKGFLKQLYKGFMEHDQSNIIIVVENEKVLGFLAYSENMSSLYKYLIKHKLFQFAWYSFIAFLKKPSILLRLLGAFNKSEEVSRNEEYIELSSIGVLPEFKGKGVGSIMIGKLKKEVNFNKCSYISLETDADNNEYANRFYQKNGFFLARTYKTKQGRKMNEYHYRM